MNLATLIQDSDLSLIAGDGAAELSDLTDDSRTVNPGKRRNPPKTGEAGVLFVARDTGDERWREYVDAAVECGAAAVVAPAVIDVPAGVALAVGPRVDQALAGRLAARFFGNPAKKLKLVGVTGTNGKTTVATYVQHLLNHAGLKCGFIGTTAVDTGGSEGPRPAELTTPGAIDLQRLLAEMVANGCRAGAMEVSSHALDQGRVDGLNFAAAVFTNLTQDHLDYHGDMDRYAAAKAKLFDQLKPDGVAVVNADSPPLIAMTPPDIQHVRWTTLDFRGIPSASVSGRAASDVITAEIWELEPQESIFEIDGLPGQDQAYMFCPALSGKHNVSNMLQAVAASHVLSAQPVEKIAEAVLECTGVPGRLEAVIVEDVASPTVLVDYAHTPDALENVLNALRPLTSEDGRLICVFGCGGDRDRTKRPLMAQAACGLADRAYLTSDNPRTEDPQRILDDALAGVPPEKRDAVVVEVDRAAAIRAAVMEAAVGDTVLIAGKGHEDYQVIGTKRIHFDDREHAADALRAWAEHHGGRASDE